jgi:hypothetical protein
MLRETFGAVRKASGVELGVLAALVLFILLQVLQSWRLPDQLGRRSSIATDFAYFYCAGAARNAGENGYLTAANDSCGGRTPAQFPILAASSGAPAVHRAPAPIPSYDVALFGVIARLPYTAAAAAWLLISTIALLITMFLLARFSGLPVLVIFAAFAVLGFRETLQYGQLPPVVFAGLTIAAYGIATGRYALVGAATAITFLEPHLAVPAFLSMLVWIPKSRVPLIVAAGVLAVIGVATLGVAGNVEYFRNVLPAQVLAEVPQGGQFSLTWLLGLLGVNDVTAIHLGDIDYAVMVIVGIAVAKYVSEQVGRVELIPLVPVAFAVVGGPYIHGFQVQAALLAALIIAGRRNDLLAWLAILLISVPWSSSAWLARPWSPSRLESTLAVAVLAYYALRHAGRPIRTAAVATASVFYISVTELILKIPDRQIGLVESPAHYLTVASNHMYASIPWGVLVRMPETAHGFSERLFLGKVPAWLGLVLVLASILVTLRNAKSASEPNRRTTRPDTVTASCDPVRS